MEYKDYYKILGVEKKSTEKDIKQAYRKLARKYHPDVNPGDKSTEQKFKEINEAYEVLGDKEKRAQYDQLGEYVQGGRIPDDFFRAQAGKGAPGGYGGVHFDFGDLGSFQSTTGNMGDFSDFFNMFFGGRPTGRGRARASAKSVNLDDLLGGSFASSNLGSGSYASATASSGAPRMQETPLELTLEEAVSGTSRLLQIDKETTCEKCRGMGSINNAVCGDCRGAGAKIKPTRIEVKIPPGVTDGNKIRVENFLLVVRLKPHPFFEIRNGELFCEVPVSVTEAVLGGEIEIPTLKGTITTKIPPETQNGKTLRLAGLGIPDRTGKPGNLYARIKVVIPMQIGAKEKKLFQELAELESENPRKEILQRQWSNH